MICLLRQQQPAVRGAAAATGLHPVVGGGVQLEGEQLHCDLAVQGGPLCLQGADVHWQDAEQAFALHRPGTAPGQRQVWTNFAIHTLLQWSSLSPSLLYWLGLH